MYSNRSRSRNKSIEIKDTYYTLANLYCLLKIFALDCTYRRDATMVSCYSACRTGFTAVALGFLTIASFYVKIAYFYGDLNPSITAMDISQHIYDYLQYMVDLYVVYKYGRTCKLEYLNYYKKIDVILSFNRHSQVRKTINRLITMFISAVIFSVSFDLGVWVLSYGWRRPLTFAVSYIFTVMKTLNFLDLASNVLNLEYRLHSICENLERWYCTATFNGGISFDDPVTNKKWIHADCMKSNNEMNLNGGRVFWVGTTKKHETRMLSKCYLLLCEQCSFINRMFGIRILLNCVSLLIDMIRFINVAVRILLGTQKTTYVSYGLPSVANLLRFLLYAALLLAVIHYCERSYRQRDRLLRVLDHMLINKDTDDEFRDSLKELRELASSRPLDFHLVHFCRLDYTLLSALASVVVTYTIILTQK